AAVITTRSENRNREICGTGGFRDTFGGQSVHRVRTSFSSSAVEAAKGRSDPDDDSLSAPIRSSQENLCRFFKKRIDPRVRTEIMRVRTTGSDRRPFTFRGSPRARNVNKGRSSFGNFHVLCLSPFVTFI